MIRAATLRPHGRRHRLTANECPEQIDLDDRSPRVGAHRRRRRVEVPGRVVDEDVDAPRSCTTPPIAATASGSRTSTGTALAEAPPARSRAPPPRSRSPSGSPGRCARQRAKQLAIPNPMPLPPPVMIATCPANRPGRNTEVGALGRSPAPRAHRHTGATIRAAVNLAAREGGGRSMRASARVRSAHAARLAPPADQRQAVVGDENAGVVVGMPS